MSSSASGDQQHVFFLSFFLSFLYPMALTLPILDRQSAFILSFLLVFRSLTTAQQLSILPTNIPSCAQSCTILQLAQAACLPPASPNGNAATYQSCFCQSSYLTVLRLPISDGRGNVCRRQCSDDDYGKIVAGYLQFCYSPISSVQSPGSSTLALPLSRPTNMVVTSDDGSSMIPTTLLSIGSLITVTDATGNLVRESIISVNSQNSSSPGVKVLSSTSTPAPKGITTSSKSPSTSESSPSDSRNSGTTSQAASFASPSSSVYLSAPSILTSPPPPGLSKPIQIGLGVGITVGALILISFGGVLTYYFLRYRPRHNPRTEDSPYSIDTNHDSGIADTAAIHRSFSGRELCGIQRARSMIELDGGHWKRELPGDEPAEKDSNTAEIG